MPKSSIAHDPALCRDTLTIKKIICFASGAPWPPPADELWDGIQADLKDACSQGELPYSKNYSDQYRRFYSIRLLDLWGFLVNRDQRWQPLRDFCHRWAQVRGVTLRNDGQRAKKKRAGRSGGRKPGSGTYTDQDRVLWAKMKATLNKNEAVSPWEAAGKFTGEAPGHGTPDSKRRRLARGYRNWINTL